MREPEVCPRCGREFSEPPARSRVDNETHICSSCGTAEAMYALSHPGEPLPPLTEEVTG